MQIIFILFQFVWFDCNINPLNNMCVCFESFSSHSRIVHSYGDLTNDQWKVTHFCLCSALMTIEQWGFFSVPHLLWHGASVYNGHLQGPKTLTPIAERLAVELSRPIFTTKVGRGWDLNTQPFAREVNAKAPCATGAVINMLFLEYCTSILMTW